jgi:hypothetical protein
MLAEKMVPSTASETQTNVPLQVQQPIQNEQETGGRRHDGWIQDLKLRLRHSQPVNATVLWGATVEEENSLKGAEPLEWIGKASVMAWVKLDSKGKRVAKYVV